MTALAAGGWGILASTTILGALVGSYLGAAVVRLPQGRSTAVGRSACDACGAALRPGELVPVISFLAQQGRCRRCSAPIDRWQFAAELGGALVGAGAAAAAQNPLAVAAGMLLGWQLLLLALLDLRHLWLPRRLVGLLALSGFLAGLLRRGPSVAGLGELLAGGLLGFAMLWAVAALYRRVRGREGMGGGDPALLGAIGLWVGPVGVVATVLGGSLIGLAGAIGLAVAGRQVAADTVLPLGAALALAGWAVWLLHDG
jgi:leader peptidase (prepilin peptidase)/N-methyltransferase